MTILIVDDNELSLYLLRVLLSGNGYQVVTAAHGAEALAKARQNPPDLVISDILMPVMDGFALCREWKKDERLKPIPFIFHTATYTDERDREFALGLGAERFIVKAGEPEVILRTIREAIQQAAIAPPVPAPLAAGAPGHIPVEAPGQEEAGFLKQYNEALIRKLEAKLQQLDQANRDLEHDITERKQAEEALQEKERLLSESQRIARIGSWSWNLTGPIKWSDETYRIYGVSPETFTPTTESLVNLIHPADRPAMRRWLEACGAGQSPDDLEFRTILPDGTVRFLRGRGELMYDAANKPTQMAGTVQDITERKRTEEALRESEEKHRVSIETTATGFVIVDAKGCVLDANDEYVRLAGYKKLEQILGRSVIGWTAAYDQARNAEEVKKCLASGSVRGLEVDYTHLDGTVVPIEINASTLGVGNSLRVVALCRDITERKRAEQVRRESERRLTTLMANLPGMVYRCQNLADWPMSFVSEGCAALTGWPLADLMRNRPAYGELIVSSDRQPVWDAVQTALAARQPFEVTYQIQAADRQIKWVWERGRGVFGEDGGLLCIEGFITDITERKQAEQMLAQERNLLRTLIDNLPDYVFVKDAQSRFVLNNRAHLGLLKAVTQAEVAGKTDGDIFLPETAARYRGDEEAVLRSGEPLVNREESTVDPTGQVRWLLTTKVPLQDQQGKITGLVGVSRDITERKRAEEALRESEERYRNLFASNPHPMWIYDLETLRFLAVNDAAVTHYGYARDEFLRMTLKNIRPAEDVQLLLDNVAHSHAVVQQSDHWRHRKKNGEIILVEITSHSLDWIGRAARVVVAHDVTARERAQEDLNRQAALLDAASEAIYVRTLDHTVTYWNIGAEQLYGWTRAEALGRKITELGNVDRQAFEAAHTAVLERGAWSGELAKISKEGKEYVVFCRWTLLRDEQGRPKEVLAINTDITQKKQLEAQFLRAQRMEGIGALAGGIAHDLNNILAPILMVAPLLRETVSDPDSRQMIDTLEGCAQRGADIIKQLLTFARGKPGARAPLPVRHFLNEMEKLIRETFPRNIQPRVSAPSDLWPILGDTTQIHQALMNLCVNARDAMPDGGTLTLAAENLALDEAFAAITPDAKPGKYVCVSVTDTGTGISPEHLGHLFDPFFTTKEIGKGTGLGLPTVLGIVRGHGGFVRLNTRVGQGTTFELYLPASPGAKEAGTSDREAPPPRGQGELILVVDDEAAVRMVVRQTLEKHGYQMLAASEGAEALALFGQHHGEVRAVVTDMMMPGMDGPTLVRALRQLDVRLPILGMTGLAERADMKGLADLHMPMLLVKPFSGVSLLAVLSQALASRQADK